MTERRVLVDTGPLVAIVSPRDEHHQTCVQQLKSLPKPLLTCWPVITEAAWLLRERPAGFRDLLAGVGTGFLALPSFDESAAGWLADFLKRYESLGAQLADASLVYLAEHENIQTVFTLDRRDFSVYRLSRNRGFKLLPENL